MPALIECVPNISEGRRAEVISRVAAAVAAVPGVRLLDQTSDADHNRSVFTFAGSPDDVRTAAHALVDAALAEIDMRTHTGAHPRLGAVDVVPFVPISGVTMDECVALAKRFGREVAERHGLTSLIAPVRPNLKESYPLVPIEQYAAWRREDGLYFDPWMRVHERLGATVLRPEPQSLRIIGSVCEWEEWTGMAFPESGEYWFPRGLAPLSVDREAVRGSYWEPNVWMRHPV